MRDEEPEQKFATYWHQFSSLGAGGSAVGGANHISIYNSKMEAGASPNMTSASEAIEERELEVISTTLQPPSAHSSRKSSTHQQDSTYLEVPPTAASENDVSSSPGSGSRRCSARVLSMNLQHTLRQLRKEEHHARVTNLLKRNAMFYKRQRFCECITMLSVLSMFTCFSLYIVFAHGFHFGQEKPFNLVHNYSRKIVRQEGESADVICESDRYWEWCRWIHMDHFCDFEWVSLGSGVQQIGCDFPQGKVEFIGDYEKHQCGLRIHDLNAKDRGIWMCEMEKYYSGFSRRYGEHRQNIVNLVIHLKPRTTTTSSPSSSSSQGTAVEATGDPTASALTPNTYLNAIGSTIRGTNTSAIQNSTAVNIVSEKEEYERNFFLLRVFVLGTIGCVFSTLTLMFWIYFMYLWRTWDAGKRDSGSVSMQPNEDLEIQRVSFCSASSGGAGAGTVGNNDNSESFEQGSEVAGGSRSSSAAAAEVEEIEEKHHPHFDRALMRSRRKSVSFAVCKVNKDTMQFDIEHKSVLLNKRGSGGGNGASGIGLPGGSSKSSKANSPLRQVAKKWRDAKNKLVLKDTLSNIWPGMARKDEFEDEETFRNRRQELMEKAKALENQASKQRKTQNDSDNDETTM